MFVLNVYVVTSLINEVKQFVLLGNELKDVMKLH